MEKIILHGYFIIAALSALVVVLGVILYEMHKYGTTYTRTAPPPPGHLRPCIHGFDMAEVIDLKKDPKCKKCGKKLSELNKSNIK